MRRALRTSLFVLALAASAATLAAAVIAGPYVVRVRHVRADPAAGFRSDYFLYVPPTRAVDARGVGALLVQPNNSGTTSDDRGVHLRDAWWTGLERRRIADRLGVALLVPAFPRTASDWRVYTHALDRDCFTTRDPELARPDLQLVAMVDDARRRLAAEGRPVDVRILLQGFSASGMFANRFTALHPARVRASTSGSPGGWPIAPVAEAAGVAMRYPAGIADLATLTGRRFDAAAFARVPQLVYMGDADDNDSLDFEDGWERPVADDLERRYGATPMARWTAARALYRDAAPAARFELVPGVGHDRKALQDRSTAFLATILAQDGRRLAVQ
ncbi:alpha/beta hydrolase family protein [Lysobacter xanthus]